MESCTWCRTKRSKAGRSMRPFGSYGVLMAVISLVCLSSLEDGRCTTAAITRTEHRLLAKSVCCGALSRGVRSTGVGVCSTGVHAGLLPVAVRQPRPDMTASTSLIRSNGCICRSETSTACGLQQGLPKWQAVRRMSQPGGCALFAAAAGSSNLLE